MSRKRLSRRDPVRRAMQQAADRLMNDGQVPTVHEVSEAAMRERTMSFDDMHRALDHYAREQARAVMTSKDPDGKRRYLPQMILGEPRYRPTSQMSPAERRNFDQFIDLPNADAAERARRRRDIETTILENETRVRGVAWLTDADVAEMVAVAHEAFGL